MTNLLLLVPCQLPYAFFIIHTLIKQVSRIKSTSASSSLRIHHSRLILTPCRCFQPCNRTPPRYLLAPCMTLCYMHPAPTLWSTTRKGRGVRPNYTRPGYFHCSSRPPQPARRPSFIAHYRPRRPGSGSHFDVEQYPMTWTPGPSVRKHASSRRAPRLVTAGPPAPPPSMLGGGRHSRSVPRLEPKVSGGTLSHPASSTEAGLRHQGGWGIRHVPAPLPPPQTRSSSLGREHVAIHLQSGHRIFQGG